MGPGTPHMLLTAGGHHWGSSQTCSVWDMPLPVLAPSGSRRNMYGWQADGMHPTGMLSC